MDHGKLLLLSHSNLGIASTSLIQEMVQEKYPGVAWCSMESSSQAHQKSLIPLGIEGFLMGMGSSWNTQGSHPLGSVWMLSDILSQNLPYQ